MKNWRCLSFPVSGRKRANSRGELLLLRLPGEVAVGDETSVVLAMSETSTELVLALRLSFLLEEALL